MTLTFQAHYFHLVHPPPMWVQHSNQPQFVQSLNIVSNVNPNLLNI